MENRNLFFRDGPEKLTGLPVVEKRSNGLFGFALDGFERIEGIVGG